MYRIQNREAGQAVENRNRKKITLKVNNEMGRKLRFKIYIYIKKRKK